MKKLIADKDDKTTLCSTMGCRTYNGYDINWHDSWKNALLEVANTGELNHVVLRSPRQKDGRGNISPVTIILPTLAMQVKLKLGESISKSKVKSFLVGKFGDGHEEEFNDFSENRDMSKEYTVNIQDAYNDFLLENTDKQKRIDEFFKLLDKKLIEAKNTLDERFEWQCQQSYKSAKFMYENNTMYGYIPEEGIESALKHGTTVIGQIGLAETLLILIGKTQVDEEGLNLGQSIEKHIKEKCAEFKKKFSRNYGNYLTPAENLCFKSLTKFRNQFGKIKGISDDNEKEFFTNSTHVPVWEKIDPFKKMDIESKLDIFSNAGCITYVELDTSAKDNLQALEKLVLQAMHDDLPYFAVNVPSDSCDDCGYQGDIGDKCPVCGSDNIQRLRRVTGYLTGSYDKQFNKGKIDEVHHREKHEGLEI